MTVRITPLGINYQIESLLESCGRSLNPLISKRKQLFHARNPQLAPIPHNNLYVRVKVKHHLPAPPTGTNNAPLIVGDGDNSRQPGTVSDARAHGGRHASGRCVRQGDVLGARPTREVEYVDAREDAAV